MNDQSIGISGYGVYIPPGRLSSAEISEQSGIPQEVIEKKLGIITKSIAQGESVVDMCTKAGQAALKNAEVDAKDIDMVIYCGSDFKDHYVWSAGIKVTHTLKAVNAIAHDITVLCAGMIVAMKHAKDYLIANPDYRHILLVSGTREGSLIDLKNERSRFMFNFGEGASAVLVSKNQDENLILEPKFITDGRLSDFVHVPQMGSKSMDKTQFVADGPVYLDVNRLDEMKDLLEETSEKNFLAAIAECAVKSGFTPQTIDYLAILHMKRSIHDYILEQLGLKQDQTYYLEHYGHVQSSDPIISIDEGIKSGRIHPGSNIVLAAAGTGYTWAAIAVQWGKKSGAV